MDRDTFWENARDILFLVIKIIVVFTVLQIVFMATRSDIKIPLVHGYMMKILYWCKDTFAGVRFGV